MSTCARTLRLLNIVVSDMSKVGVVRAVEYNSRAVTSGLADALIFGRLTLPYLNS